MDRDGPIVNWAVDGPGSGSDFAAEGCHGEGRGSQKEKRNPKPEFL